MIEPPTASNVPPLPHLTGANDAATILKYKKTRQICGAVLVAGLFILYQGNYMTASPTHKLSRLQMGAGVVLVSLIGIVVSSVVLRTRTPNE